MKNIKNLSILLVVLILVMLGGFYFLTAKISTLQTALQNQSGSPVNQNTAPNQMPTPTSSVPTSAGATSTTPSAKSGISLSSNILFTASSSADLQPQTNLTILINKISKLSDGTIAVAVKVFTDSATSYSAVDMSNLIQVFNVGGSNGVSNNIVGAFKAMPPQGAVDGVVNFPSDPSTQSVILQVGSPDSPSFYEFDFDTNSYKQITVG